MTMAQKLNDMFEIFNRPYADPVQLPLASSPWPMFTIIAFYLLFVLKLGRMFMAERQPYDLRNVLKAYNIMQIVYNSVTFLLCCGYLITRNVHSLSCLMVMRLDHPYKNIERALAYAYYFNKFVDLLDTLFFVLRKSYKQISILHVMHHVYMPIGGYFVIRFNGYGGQLIVLGLLNLFVHIVMYSYYYLSSQNPLIKQSRWKQYITLLQMTQLLLVGSHSVWTLMQPNCLVSRELCYMIIIITATMFCLFTNFYIHAYIKPKKAIIDKKLH